MTVEDSTCEFALKWEWKFTWRWFTTPSHTESHPARANDSEREPTRVNAGEWTRVNESRREWTRVDENEPKSTKFSLQRRHSLGSSRVRGEEWIVWQALRTSTLEAIGRVWTLVSFRCGLSQNYSYLWLGLMFPDTWLHGPIISSHDLL